MLLQSIPSGSSHQSLWVTSIVGVAVTLRSESETVSASTATSTMNMVRFERKGDRTRELGELHLAGKLP
jgi:hypothetical protein